MDQRKQMLKQMIEFNQAMFNNTCNAIALAQDQFEKIAGNVLNQATWLPDEGRKAIEQWVESYKTGRDNFKKYVDESYKKVEEYFAS